MSDEQIKPEETVFDETVETVRIVTPDSSNSRKRRRETKREAAKDETTPKRSISAPRYRKGMYVEPMTQIYATVGTMLYPFDPFCGSAILEQAQPCAESLDALAEKNVRVRAMLESMTQTSAWGVVLAAHAPLILAVASHHNPALSGRLPRPVGADTVPDDLSGLQ